MIDTALMRARRSISMQAAMPMLKHYFPCNNATDRLIDTQGGVVWTPTNGTADAGNAIEHIQAINAIHPIMESDGQPIALLEGAWETIPNGAAFMFVVAGRTTVSEYWRYVYADPPGQYAWLVNFDEDYFVWPPMMAATRCSIGTINASINGSSRHGIGMSWNPFHAVAGIGAEQAFRHQVGVSTSPNSPEVSVCHQTAPAGTDVLQVLTYVPGTQTLAAYNINTGATILQADTSLSTGIYTTTLTSAISPSAYMRTSGLALYGLSIYVFPSGSLPDDAITGALWEGNAWMRGWRVPYPGAVLWE